MHDVGSGYKEKLRGIRREYQKSLLKWLQTSDAGELRVMVALTSELEDLSQSEHFTRLWRIATAYLEMMALSPEPAGIARNKAPARFDQLLKKLIEQGEGGSPGEKEEGLIEEMLHDIGCSACNSELLSEIRHTFNLNEVGDRAVHGFEEVRPASELVENHPAQAAGSDSDNEVREDTCEALQQDEPGGSELDDALVRKFTAETLEHLGTLRNFTSAGGTSMSAELLRVVHTLRRTSRSLHLVEMSNLFYSLDEHLNRVHDQGTALGPADTAVLDKAVVLSAKVLDRLNADRTFPAALREEFDRLQEELERSLESDAAASAQGELRAVAGIDLLGSLSKESRPAAQAIEGTGTVAEIAPAGRTAGRLEPSVESGGIEDRESLARETHAHEVLRIDSGVLDKLVNSAGELSMTRAQMQEHLAALQSILDELGNYVARIGDQFRHLEMQADLQLRPYFGEPLPEPEKGATRGSEFDLLKDDRNATLQQLFSGLSESVDDLANMRTGISRVVHDSESVLRRQAQLVAELQNGLMTTRLVPFSSVLPRLRQQARRVARELEKDVELRVTGGEVGIDRRVLDGISEALDHMVSNAVEHGIEDPDDREALEKSRTGTILIECMQRGSEFIIRLGDDGKGLDAAAITEKAVSQGLLVSADPVSDQQLIQLIVFPGFTTATDVARRSDRGVGMHVVHDAVRKLGGSIVADSRPGQGTTFELSLPLSLSITQAIFVRCGGQEFAIPLNFVQSVMKVDDGEIVPSGDGRSLFEKDGENYPLLDLTRHFGPARGAADQQRAAILIARIGAREVAVKVSELLGSREVVVKSLGGHVSGVEGIAGATVRADGSVVIILDLAGLWIANQKLTAAESTVRNTPEKTPLVLVVDDSLTVRKVTAHNLSSHGMEVVMAKDGLDAVEKMGKRRPDLMLIDIEMPRMDGFELTSRVRDDPLTRDIPIVVITSRAGAENHEKAMSLGANDYLIKPYHEEELLVRVERCLAHAGFYGS